MSLSDKSNLGRQLTSEMSGYQVPDAVISVIGGGRTGGATVTGPINTATEGPLATGKPITYTITNSTSNGSKSTGKDDGAPNVGAIVAGTIAGILFVIACYLAFCAYLYRKQLQLYKRHMDMSQAQARGEKLPAISGLLSTNASSGRKSLSDASYARGEGNTVTPWMTTASGGDSHHRRSDSGNGSVTAAANQGMLGGYASLRRNSEASDGADEDLLAGREPTFVGKSFPCRTFVIVGMANIDIGVILNPRRSLRVVNREM